MEPTSETGPGPSNPPSRGLGRRVWEWLWQGSALGAAVQLGTTLKADQRLLVEQARSVFDLGERVRDRITTVTAASTETTSLILFHQAGTLALMSLAGTASGTDKEARALWEARKPDVVRTAGLDATAEARLDQLFPAPFLIDAGHPELQLKADASILQQALGAFLGNVEAPHRQADIVRGLRFFRMTVLVLGLLGISTAAVVVGKKWMTPPNLLEGKAWQASSTYPGLDVGRQVCDGKSTTIFFHTKQETNPWVQFDIGTETSVRRVEVRNRTDYGSKRSIPLVIEVSRDAKTWSEVARKNEDFKVWEADFPAVQARYVRARAANRTWLHLEWLKAR